MAKFSGQNATFTVGGTAYSCLEDWTWNGGLSEATAECSGASGAVTHRIAGATDNVFNFTHLIDAADNTTVDNLKAGTTGTFEAHPEGDTTGNIEFTATLCVITNSTLSAPVSGIATLSLTIGIDGALTIQAAV